MPTNPAHRSRTENRRQTDCPTALVIRYCRKPFAILESQTDALRLEFEFRHRHAEDIAECARIQRVQPALRSIYLLELSLLSHRRRAEIDADLTQLQTQALDHFLKSYSNKLTHIAAWISHEEEAPARISDDSIQLSNPSKTAAPQTRRLSLLSVRSWSPLSSCCGTSVSSYSLYR